MDNVEYLGHLISAKGVSTDPSKIQAMKNWPRPLNVKRLSKKNSFGWNVEAESAFQTLKEAMITTPVLGLPNFNREFVVETNICAVGIGEVLLQEGHPIAYMSKALSPKHQALSTYEKEFLAVLLALEKWKGPLGGHSRVHVTAKKLADVFFWKGLNKMVKFFVKECNVCQRYKPDLSAYPGLIQPLPIPTHVWSEISIDFIESLPKSQRKSIILVVVDRLSTYAHFMALQHPFSTSDVAKLFLNNIYKLHGLPKVIVSDRDKATPYKIVYGQPPPIHLPNVPGDSMVEVVDRSLHAREKVIQMLQFHLKRAQDRMVNMANKSRSERVFEIGDWAVVEGVLPSCEDDEKLLVEPVAVLERRLGKVQNKPVMFVLVEWANQGSEDAT
nr:hypothetical protein [Tanacetum cinerariifolium]